MFQKEVADRIVENDNDKNTVIALREIADSTLTVNEMKENLIQEYQTVTLSDEEEEILSFQKIIEKNNPDENDYESSSAEESILKQINR